MDSLAILAKQVEKATALGLSWPSAVQLLTLAALTEVSSQLEALSKALSDGRHDASAPGTSKRAGRTPGKRPAHSRSHTKRKHGERGTGGDAGSPGHDETPREQAVDEVPES